MITIIFALQRSGDQDILKRLKRLNLSLVRSNARAFLARAGPRAKVSDLYLDG